MAIKLRAPRRRSSLASKLFWALMLLAALYSAAWFGGVKVAQSYAADWLAKEAERGRQWACAEPSVSGFPFSLRLTCAQPALTMTGETGANAFAAKSMEARLDVFSPMQVNIRFEAPVTAKLKNGDVATLKAAQIVASAGMQLGGADKALQSLRLTADAPDLAVLSASGRNFAGKAARAALSMAAAPGAADAMPSYDLVFDADGAKIPALEALTQSAEPAKLHIAGLLSNFEMPGRGTPAERLERWRAAGGVFTLSQSSLSNGATQIEASGPLGLDEEHRLSGKLALKLRGAGPILQRFGVPANVLNAGNLLGALLGKPKKPDAEPAPGAEPQGGGISVPLTLQGGKALAGPVPLPVQLQPLY